MTCSALFCDRFYVRADIFEGHFFATPNTIKIKLFKTFKTQGQAWGNVECPYVFKILNMSIFDGAWHHTKLTFNSLKFGYFQIFELYDFWDSNVIGK